MNENEEGVGTIVDIKPRRNGIVRPSPKNKRLTHLIAANLDQVFLVVTFREPDFKAGFADRFLTMATAHDVPATILFNKEDLLSEEDKTELEEIKSIYRDAGYPAYSISAEQGSGLDLIKGELISKTTLISGQSGVGKSTLLNRLVPGIQLKTKQLSGYTGKGQHTTTFATMYQLDEDSFVIDTPGVKEYGITNITPEELGHYFPDIAPFVQQCKFNNCLHDNEPGCAVRQAFLEGRISEMRYTNYIYILYDILEEQ